MAMPAAGEFWLIRYNVHGPPLFHERLVLSAVAGPLARVYTLTPDLDHYEETFDIGADVAEVHRLPVRGVIPAGVAAAQVYGFFNDPPQLVVDGYAMLASHALGTAPPVVPFVMQVPGAAPAAGAAGGAVAAAGALAPAVGAVAGPGAGQGGGGGGLAVLPGGGVAGVGPGGLVAPGGLVPPGGVASPALGAALGIPPALAAPAAGGECWRRPRSWLQLQWL